MAAILFLPFGRCSQLPYSVAIKTCSLHQPPTNPALPGFILIGIKIVNSFRNYLLTWETHKSITSQPPSGAALSSPRSLSAAEKEVCRRLQDNRKPQYGDCRIKGRHVE